jgi:predicted N-acetyltransferase YhbS
VAARAYPTAGNAVDRARSGSDPRPVRELPGGLIRRPARAGDLDGIGALLTARGEAADAADQRLIAGDPDAGIECTAVVVDRDRVVSTVTLLDETLYLGAVPVPVGQVELVATDTAYEGRGLVRALLGWAHERSAARGHLAQLVVGIPYFYRLFGYQYAIAVPRARAVRGMPPLPSGHVVRQARPADIPAMARLQDAAQRGRDVRMPHSAATWRWLIARPGTIQLVVEHTGEVVATGRVTPPEEGDPVLGEIAAASGPAAVALLASAGAAEVHERPGVIDALDPYLEPPPARADSYYVRVPDAVALLRHLRPVLGARFAASAEADATGEAVVSFFREHVRIVFHDGAVDVVPGGRMQAPGVHGGAGVAPDQVAPLLFGPLGIAGLADRHPDVYPGRHERLMCALFPPLTSDLLALYLP